VCYLGHAMRRALLPALLCLSLALAAQAQEKPTPPPDKASSSTGYSSPELGLEFPGVYGWASHVAAGSAAWTELARWNSDESLDSFVSVLVRDNPYETTDELRAALAQEFAASDAEPTAERPVYKEVTITAEDMKKGIGLPGFQVDAIRLEINEEGKKRERQIATRSWFGKNRLFRVYCEARRARAKRVKDIFDRALNGLVVNAVAETMSRGTWLRSAGGLYTCLVPEGFLVVTYGGTGGPTDARLESAKRGISVSLVSYPFEGILADHRESVEDYYRDSIKIDKDETSVMGSKGFLATITKGDSVTYVAGIVANGRAYRVHTAAAAKNAEDAKRVHEEILKSWAAIKG